MKALILIGIMMLGLTCLLFYDTFTQIRKFPDAEMSMSVFFTGGLVFVYWMRWPLLCLGIGWAFILIGWFEPKFPNVFSFRPSQKHLSVLIIGALFLGVILALLVYFTN